MLEEDLSDGGSVHLIQSKGSSLTCLDQSTTGTVAMDGCDTGGGKLAAVIRADSQAVSLSDHSTNQDATHHCTHVRNRVDLIHSELGGLLLSLLARLFRDCVEKLYQQIKVLTRYTGYQKYGAHSKKERREEGR